MHNRDVEIDDISVLLRRYGRGDRELDDVVYRKLYDQLRDIARQRLRRERQDHTLQPTALVNEAFLKLAMQRDVQWQGRSHFLAVASQAMRRILVDYARNRKRHKRDGGLVRVELGENTFEVNDEAILALDQALTKLAGLSETQARIVELRFFGGLTVPETAEAIGLSDRTVKREWSFIRSWLRAELYGECAHDAGTA